MATEYSFLKEHDELIKKSYVTLQEAEKACDAYTYPSLSWIKGANGVFLKSNKPFSDFFQLPSPEMIVGINDFDLNHVSAGYTAYDFRFTDQCVMKGASYNKKIELVILPNEAPHLILVTKIPVLSDDYKSIAVHGVAHALTPAQVQELNNIATLAPACAWTKDLKPSALTDTEAQIQIMRNKLKLSVKEIATIRNSSRRTIDTHLYNIRVKLYGNINAV